MVQLSPQGAYNIIEPLVLFILGLAVHSILVFNLYKFVAKRDIFELNLRQYNRLQHKFLYKIYATFLYFLEYLLFFPLFLTVWFIAFSIMIISLTNQTDAATVLLISMAIVSTIRVLSYYKQTLSKEVAKLLPFALLAVFLMDISFFSWEKSWNLLIQIPSMLEILIYYFAFVVGLEFILRIFYSISKALFNRDEK